MDKKSIFIGIFFLVGGFLLMLNNAQQETKARQEHALRQIEQQQRALAEQDATPATGEPVTRVTPPAFEAAEEAVRRLESPAATAAIESPEQLLTIENQDIRVELTNRGGAISRIFLLNYPEEHPRRAPDRAPVILNNVSENPALELRVQLASRLVQLAPVYDVVEATPTRVVFQTQLTSGLIIERRYEVEFVHDRTDPGAFSVHHETRFLNSSDGILSLNNVFLNVGTAAPTAADYMGFNLNASLLRDGKYRSIAASKFSGGGFFNRTPREFIEQRGLIQWGSVKNQFFVTIFTPDEPALALTARGVRFPRDPSSGRVPVGITADMEFAIDAMRAGDSVILGGQFYAGPKNFDRLSRMQLSQEDVMQLGWFLGMFLGIISFVAKLMLTLMGWIHGMVGNWGIAIILTTFVIRLLLWPLTAKAARASKRMQKLQKPLTELREKYKDNPQKLQTEMMALWKKHKISPLSGCWPVLIQLPIFIAFFNLLRNSSDLRFAEFLWIRDLSMPDATIPFPEGTSIPLVGTAINVLPFVWLVSMYFQMKMMPTPSVDNAQVKIMKWMPFIFFPFTYYFSSGLVLYWTTTNVFSIFQQWITNRTRDEEDDRIDEEVAELENPTKKKMSGPLISKKKKKKPEDRNGRR